MNKESIMDVKVLGTGCAKCQKLYDVALQAVEAAGVDAQVTKVEKIDEIITYGVAVTPGLVINGKVKSAGKLPDVKQVAAWLKEAQEKG
jgi:small redox-active disulfide protein 2